MIKEVSKGILFVLLAICGTVFLIVLSMVTFWQIFFSASDYSNRVIHLGLYIICFFILFLILNSDMVGEKNIKVKIFAISMCFICLVLPPIYPKIERVYYSNFSVRKWNANIEARRFMVEDFLVEENIIGRDINFIKETLGDKQDKYYEGPYKDVIESMGASGRNKIIYYVGKEEYLLHRTKYYLIVYYDEHLVTGYEFGKNILD